MSLGYLFVEVFVIRNAFDLQDSMKTYRLSRTVNMFLFFWLAQGMCTISAVVPINTTSKGLDASSGHCAGTLAGKLWFWQVVFM